MTRSSPRICSLLPSATEIIFALGLQDNLVGVTHECDFPPEARDKPHVTRSLIDAGSLSGAEIDAAVRESLADGNTIYGLDDALLRRLEPDVILTQELCDVCAVGPDLVREAVQRLPSPSRVVSLEPHTLEEVLESIVTVGDQAGAGEAARDLVSRQRNRLDAVRAAVAGLPRRRVLTLEWLDPVFVGGHWVPEMVSMAGGLDVLGQAGRPSREVPWNAVVEADPDCVVAMPCGFDLDRTLEELRATSFPPEWERLRAVRSGDVYAVDGSAYFSRPGPRLIDGVEILASILHPEAFQTEAAGLFVRCPVSSPRS
jgi:iron complex transport system substrate-binding protein